MLKPHNAVKGEASIPETSFIVTAFQIVTRKLFLCFGQNEIFRIKLFIREYQAFVSSHLKLHELWLNRNISLKERKYRCVGLTDWLSNKYRM